MKRKILLGLTGSVATTLHKKIIEALSKYGEVIVIPTEKALHFSQDVYFWYNKMYKDSDEWKWKENDLQINGIRQWEKDDPVLHIKLRDEASALVIAPCSANTMGKIAYGLCDNLLTTVARAWDFNRPFIIAPAMNTNMWNHIITKDHLDNLEGFGCKIIEPQSKKLACGTEGIGAMADISKIKKCLDESLKWYFPLANCSGIPVGNHPGAFGTQRKHEKHTGVDLYTDDGARVRAVEDGVVVGVEHFTGEWDNSPWWNNTDCILIEGASGVVCYGELRPAGESWYHPRIGAKIKRGEHFAYVKRVLKEGKERPDIPGHSTSMLHVELYPHGTKKASAGFEDFLLDPTEYLMYASNSSLKKLEVK